MVTTIIHPSLAILLAASLAEQHHPEIIRTIGRDLDRHEAADWASYLPEEDSFAPILPPPGQDQSTTLPQNAGEPGEAQITHREFVKARTRTSHLLWMGFEGAGWRNSTQSE